MKKKLTSVLVAGGVVLLASGAVMAGTDATFQTVADTLKNWSEGSLGTTVAIGTLVVGLATAIVRQSLMPAAVAAGVAVTANWGPGILSGMFSAIL